MKSLRQRVLDLVPDGGASISLQSAAKALSQKPSMLRAIFEALDRDGDAKLFIAGKGGALHLAAPASPILVCAVCRHSFTRNPKSKRLTCSGKCKNSLAWADPEKAAKRRASIAASKNTPKAMAILAAHNKRRWSKPGERERLAEQNRREWKDQEKAAIRGAKIRINHQTDEFRNHLSKVKTAQWKDPVIRQRMNDAACSSKKVAAYRASMSERMKQRWQDGDLRQKYTAANREKNRLRAERAAKNKSVDGAPA